MIVCAGEIESFDFATPIGIGLVESSIRLTRLIMQKRPKSLLFIGSAGSYGNFGVFDIFHSTKASNTEICSLNNDCYTPIKEKIIASNHNVSCETPLALVNSSNYITTNKQASNNFLKLGFEAENMEFFSFLSVANSFKIDALGIFIITNYCDKFAHKEFVKNHQKAKELLSLHVKEIKDRWID